MPHSVTEENYVKAIYKLSTQRERVATNMIAKYLKTSPASVTDMIKKLSEKKLITYQPYKGVKLTDEGQKIALKVIRKHRLWEVFLVKVLNFSWDEIHDTAEQLEHINSPELVDKLDEFLGFPKFDPHGDPIPSKTGKFEERNTYILSELAPGSVATMAGVLMHTTAFLQYLDKIALNIGASIKVLDALSYNNSLQIEAGGKELIITGEVARNILVMKASS